MQHQLAVSAAALGALLGAGLPASAGIATHGLVDYFDADTGVTLALDGSVTGWTNSGPGNDITSADPQTSVVAGPNAQNMIRFNNLEGGPGSGQPGLTYANGGNLAGGFTVVMAVRFPDADFLEPSSEYPRLYRDQDDSNALFIRQNNSGNSTLEFKSNPVSTGSRPDALYSDTYADNDLAIITARATLTSIELYFNGVLIDASGVSVASYDISGSSTMEIGNGVIGDIGNVLVYDNTATLADLDETGLQLASDYGVTYTRIVPEPASASLLIAGLAMLRRRRRD